MNLIMKYFHKIDFSIKSTTALFIVVLLWAPICYDTPACGAVRHFNPKAPLKILVQDKGQDARCREIVRDLKYSHYQYTQLNDHFSAKIFSRYLNDLDGSHIYFSASDIREFEKYRYTLDDALKSGDLAPAFAIFNRFQKRLSQRMNFIIQEIKSHLNHMNFNVDEKIRIERKETPWPDGIKKQRELWRKRLKNEVLVMKLDKKPLKKIKETLLRRYENQLNRIKQKKSEDVFRTFMNSYAQSYDPHTQYFSPRVEKNFDILMSLSLEGIGALLQASDEYTKIVRLIPAGPADKSGLLKPGDKIVGVGQGKDGDIEDVVGWRLDDVVDLIRGPKNTVVRLRIIPGDSFDQHQAKTISIVRNKVKLEEQAASKKMVDLLKNKRKVHLGVIKLPTFYIDFNGYEKGDKNYKSTTRDVRKLVKELETQGVDGIILDLRDNGGGALQEANKLTGLFIKNGPVVQVRGHSKGARVLYDPDPDILYDGPLVVLINRLSASASEILAGAIQDYHRGIIVGSQSFGKGTIQSLERLKKGQLKVTEGKFYRISGESTQDRGVTPDIVFPSLYDSKKIGESSMPEAMQWDRIGPARYLPYSDKSALIEKLKILHERRVENDPGFTYINAAIKKIDEARSREWFSLKESTRSQELKKSEKERFELSNLFRKAEGKDLYKNIAEFKAAAKEDSLKNKPEKDGYDPILRESERILCDYINLQAKTIAKR